jgi:rSAM/selenodomain-associated transferase 2
VPAAPVSVVVPALNEASGLAATLWDVLRQPGLREVIVADGGSEDGTPEVAAAAGARVVHAPRGRARQMNAGAAAATGSVLLFLHADTRLPADGLCRAAGALARPGVVAGCFRLRFDQSSPLLRFYTLPIWMRWHRLAFGDRALFVRRETFDAAGGFPDQPIFEDLDMVRRLRRLGRFVFLDAAVTTSARRYAAGGAFRQQARNAALWAAWWGGVPPARLARYYPYPPPPRA